VPGVWHGYGGKKQKAIALNIIYFIHQVAVLKLPPFKLFKS